MKATIVHRDKFGMWVHPDLPKWGENTSTEQAEAWFASNGLTHHLVLMGGEIGERWSKGELESCAEWQPEPEVNGAFLVGIWDTPDGVVAMFASPNTSTDCSYPKIAKKLLADVDSHRARLAAFLSLTDAEGLSERQVLTSFYKWNLQRRLEFNEKFLDGSERSLTFEEGRRFVEYVCTYAKNEINNELLDQYSAD
ncbi:hypothetical protein [Vibrio owensii]|uniref:hypothetical protein n=1 Tax=Vibrio owensii TaxID=696485 RepID=UPI003CE551C7